MNATILALATAVPETSITQESYGAAVGKLMHLDPSQSKFLERIIANCQINQRYSVVKDFATPEVIGDFFQEPDIYPCTQKRNDLYKEEAPKLAEKACRTTIESWGGDCSAITHVISVSCTGMIAPGIEFLLINKLGLSPNVERLGINFMGCFGAFKGLAIAKALALENPKHRILLVCTELCSLHFQGDLKPETIVANAIFADGAAAVIVGCHPQHNETALFEMHQQASQALALTEELMSWEAGNFGYQMHLSAKVPYYVEKHINAFVERLTSSELTYDQLTWAVHPGGAAILNSVAKACGLEHHQMAASWSTLRHYGNMSSSTFLFVLKEVLEQTSSLEWVVGLGFGPGLSFEGSLMRRIS